MKTIALWTTAAILAVATAAGCTAPGRPPTKADDIARKIHDTWHRVDDIGNRLDHLFHATHPDQTTTPPPTPVEPSPKLTHDH